MCNIVLKENFKNANVVNIEFVVEQIKKDFSDVDGVSTSLVEDGELTFSTIRKIITRTCVLAGALAQEYEHVINVTFGGYKELQQKSDISKIIKAMKFMREQCGDICITFGDYCFCGYELEVRQCM